MNAMRAPDHDRHGDDAMCLLLQHIDQPVRDPSRMMIERFGHLHGERRIDNVRRGEPHVQEPVFWPNRESIK
jgi:hypothetical protein